MAIAAEQLAAPAARALAVRAVSRQVQGGGGISAGGVRRALVGPASSVQPATPQAAPVRIVTRLLWALAVGLVVLEIAAQATGQTWSWSLQGFGRKPQPKQPYQPLYGGQPTNTGASQYPYAAASALEAAMPGHLGIVAQQGANAPGFR